MGSWCSVENTKTNIIEVEEFDNFHETFIGVPFIDEIKTGDKDTAIINTFRKTLSSSIKAVRKNFTVGYKQNFKKNNSRKQTIKELIIHYKDVTKENFEEPVIDEELTIDEENLLRKILFNYKLISHEMEEEVVNEIVFSFYSTKVLKSTKLCVEGEPAHLLYVVLNGKLICIKDKEVTTITNGNIIGLSSLKENAIHDCSIKTKTDCKLLCLYGEVYRNAIEAYEKKGLQERIEYIQKISILKFLDEKTINTLATKLKKRCLNGIIHNEGELFDKIYILISGIVHIKFKNKIIKTISTGEYFGDISLFCENKSEYIYETDGNMVKLYELDLYQIVEIIGSDYIASILKSVFISATLGSSKLKNYLLCESLPLILNAFKLEYYERNRTVFSKNLKLNKKICIVLSGNLVKENKISEIVASSDQLYGEDIIDSVENLESNLIPEFECLVFEAYWHDILKSIKCSSSDEISLYSYVSNLKKIPIFSVLTELKLFMLAKHIKNKSFNNNEKIITEGKLLKELYIIVDGKVRIYKKKRFVRELETNSIFGDLSKYHNYFAEYTVVAEGYADCYIIDKNSLKEIMEQNFYNYLNNLIILQDSSINLEDLYFIKILGAGKFGRVYLVHNKKNVYALKAAEIKKIHMQTKLMEYYLNEKNIMLQIDFPFIGKLVKTMKNKDMIFFLMEYIDGITLKQYLEKRTRSNLKNVYETQFLGAILLHTINYLHKKRILHRDIKPENCMIDKNVFDSFLNLFYNCSIFN